MEVLIGIVAVILLVITIRIVTRRRRNARRIRKANKRRARMHHGYRRTVKMRGISGTRICTDVAPNGQVCGLPAGKCQHLRRQAEHAEGIHGKKK